MYDIVNVYMYYSTKETYIWLPWHIISISGIATHIIWYQSSLYMIGLSE